MAGLQIEYSKEIARELTKIAVVLPGSPVRIGDVLYFPFGRGGIWPFRKAKPRGSFDIVSDLSSMGMEFDLNPPDTEPDPYIFSSRGAVDVNFVADVSVPQAASGEVTAKFRKEGALFFSAVDCTRQSMKDVAGVVSDLLNGSPRSFSSDVFIVTSVTTARRALIMQSSASGAELKVSGKVQGLVTGSGSDIDASANISVNSFIQQSLIKPWSENVTVFMGLHRIRKVQSPESVSVETLLRSGRYPDEGNLLASEFIHTTDDRYVLEAVTSDDVISDDDETLNAR